MCAARNSLEQLPLRRTIHRMSKSIDQGTLDIYVTRNQSTLPDAGTLTTCIDTYAHYATVIRANREADQIDSEWQNLRASLGFVSSATIYDRILFPTRRWAVVDPAPIDSAAPKFITIDDGPVRWLTAGQANRLYAKLTGSLRPERLEILPGLPLIAVHEWLCDPLDTGWFFFDTATGVTFWIETTEELETIYGKHLCESEVVIGCHNRSISDWAERVPQSQQPSQVKYEVFPPGITVFPDDAARAMLFDHAAHCLNCLRDDEMPKTSVLRRFSRRSGLDVESVLTEAYKAGAILHDDIVMLSLYLEQDSLEHKDYKKVARMTDNPEADAEQEELDFVYGTDARGQRQLRLDRQKAVGWRFQLREVSERHEKKKTKVTATKTVSYLQLARAWKSSLPRNGAYLRRIVRKFLGCHGPEHTEAVLSARGSKGKLEVAREWVDEVRCNECGRFRLVDSGIPENRLKSFNCVRMREFLIRPFSCGDNIDQRLRHYPWCDPACQQHLMWIARKKFRIGGYIRA